jgi:polyphosphate kinase
MVKQKKKYINREISWLSFNERVLQEAADAEVPLLERLKFLGIYSSNLDEYFSVRVGSLLRMQKAGIKAKAIIGESPKKVLNEIQKIVLRQRDMFDTIFQNVQEELKKNNIFVINEKELNQEQVKFVRNYLEEEVRPRLVPIILNDSHKFPYIKNQVIYLAIYLTRRDNPDDKKYALIELPVGILPRYFVLPEINQKKYIIIIDDVVRYGLKEIFAIFDYDSIEAFTIKLTRDAEFDIDDDITKSFFEKIANSVKQRQWGQPVRFVYDREIPSDLLEFILKKNDMKKFDNLIPGGRYHNAKDFMNFPNIGDASLQYKSKPILRHPCFKSGQSIFKLLRQQDVLLHYPYQSFHHMIDLLREAAIDPAVTSIKFTIYRLAKKSNVINALINASRNGKAVTVVMELQARFDEEANIQWTKKLEEENVKLIDGVPGLKVHSKLCLITRRENNKIKFYASIGTGNFNETTAKIYSDHSFLTSDKQITDEVNKVFKFLENNYKTYNYKHLLVSPFCMRKKLNQMINREIANAKNGKNAYILIKLNNLVDQELINKLYKANNVGVKIEMIIRGICSLIPSESGMSENIQAISIIDKYLEHSRFFIFGNGGDEKYYLSSADWMIRNLDNRVEVATPIYDPHIQKEIKDFFNIQMNDIKKARIINKYQDNSYRESASKTNGRAQEDVYYYLKKMSK